MPPSLRRTFDYLLLAIVGAACGVGAVAVWRSAWLRSGDWTGVLAIAILANAIVAVLPVWRDARRRRRQGELLRFRLWLHFSKLRWILAHVDEQDPTRLFLSPGYGGEELFGIEVLLAQAHMLEISEYEWVIFTVNAALPFFGRPLGELASHAVRLLWTVDATLAQLNRRSFAQAEASNARS